MKYGDITVIIPVKERLKLLKSALISINNQRFKKDIYKSPKGRHRSRKKEKNNR